MKTRSCSKKTHTKMEMRRKAKTVFPSLEEYYNIAWIPGVVLVRALQKCCKEPGLGDRCISDASEPREALFRNLAIHRCKQSLAQASSYWVVCLENVMDAWWEFSELKEISTVPKVYIVLWDSIYRLTTYGPSKLIFPEVLSFSRFDRYLMFMRCIR